MKAAVGAVVRLGVGGITVCYAAKRMHESYTTSPNGFIYAAFAHLFWATIGTGAGAAAAVQSVMDAKGGVVVMSCGIFGLIVPLGAAVAGGCVNAASAAVLFAMKSGVVFRVGAMTIISSVVYGTVYKGLVSILGGRKSASPKDS